MKNLIMKMGYFAFCAIAVCFTSAAWAELPVVSEVSMSQQGHRKVTITYSLSDAPGIVTLEILKNGEPIDGTLVQKVSGDVNKLIEPTTDGEVCTIYWQANESWPDQSFNEPTVSARVTAWATNTPPNVLVVDLDNGAMSYYLDESYLPEGGISNDLYRTSQMVLHLVPAGGIETTLGGFFNEYDGQFATTRNKEVRHKVRLTKDFYMGVFEVTQAQWSKIYGSANGSFKNEDYSATRPVETVWREAIRSKSWTPKANDSIAETSFIGKLNKKTGVTFDLPTECQWEFAAHGGTDEMFYNGQTYITLSGSSVKTSLFEAATNNLSKLGRWKGNGGYVNGISEPDVGTCTTDNGTARVGSYSPNSYGLYDMLGNVQEICREVGIKADNRVWSSTNITDPVSSWTYNSQTDIDNSGTGEQTLTKGGSWKDDWYMCRPAATAADFQNWTGANCAGFRVILEVQ